MSLSTVGDVKLRIVLAVAVVLAGSCSGDGEDASATSTTVSAVELIDAGTAPRTLRLRPAAGAEQRVTMRQQQSQRATIGGQTQQLELPGTEIDVLYRVNAVRGRRIEAETVYEAARVLERPGVDASIVGQLRQVLDAAVGKRSRSVYDDRGTVLDFEAPELNLTGQAGQVAEQFLSGLNDQVETLALPLPADPVGVGAKWRVTTSPTIGGLRMKITTELTLTEVTETTAVAALVQAIDFLPGPFEFGGVSATVESGSMRGTGTARWDLTKVVPLLEQTTEGTSVLVIGEGDQRQRLEQFQHQTVAIVAR